MARVGMSDSRPKVGRRVIEGRSTLAARLCILAGSERAQFTANLRFQPCKALTEVTGLRILLPIARTEDA
jgi:hypothetical protein